MSVRITSVLRFALLLTLCCPARSALADKLPSKDGVAAIAAISFSPYAGRDCPTRVLWGDTHLHAAVSVDAGTMCRIDQEDAYCFARGQEITPTHRLRAKLSRPLDFLVISDHAEMYGLMPQLLSGDEWTAIGGDNLHRPRRRHEGPPERQSRSHPDRQGMAGRRRQDA